MAGAAVFFPWVFNNTAFVFSPAGLEICKKFEPLRIGPQDEMEIKKPRPSTGRKTSRNSAKKHVKGRAKPDFNTSAPNKGGFFFFKEKKSPRRGKKKRLFRFKIVQEKNMFEYFARQKSWLETVHPSAWVAVRNFGAARFITGPVGTVLVPETSRAGGHEKIYAGRWTPARMPECWD